MADGLAVAVGSSRPQRGELQRRPKRRDRKHGGPTVRCHETCEYGCPEMVETITSDRCFMKLKNVLNCIENYGVKSDS